MKNIYCLFRSSHGKFEEDAEEKNEALLDVDMTELEYTMRWLATKAG